MSQYALANYALDQDDDLSDVVPTQKFLDEFPNGVPIVATDHLIRTWDNFLEPTQTLHDTLTVFEYERHQAFLKDVSGDGKFTEVAPPPLNWLRMGWWASRRSGHYDSRKMCRQVAVDHLRLYSLRELAVALASSTMQIAYEIFGHRYTTTKVDWNVVSDMVENGDREDDIRAATPIAALTLASYKRMRGLQTASERLDVVIEECHRMNLSRAQAREVCQDAAAEAGVGPDGWSKRWYGAKHD